MSIKKILRGLNQSISHIGALVMQLQLKLKNS